MGSCMLRVNYEQAVPPVPVLATRGLMSRVMARSQGTWALFLLWVVEEEIGSSVSWDTEGLHIAHRISVEHIEVILA